MHTFYVLPGNFPDIDWNTELCKFSDKCYKQNSEFLPPNHQFHGNKKKFRAVLIIDNIWCVMMQGVLYTLPFRSALLVVRGGPLFQISGDNNKNFRNLNIFLFNLRSYFLKNYNLFYINIILYSEKTPDLELSFFENNFKRPYLERSSYLTSIINIDPPTNLKAMDVKWRNQLRKSLKLEHQFSFDSSCNSINLYVNLHNEMSDFKKIPSIRLKHEILLQLKKCFSENFLCLLGRLNGKLVCGCIVIVYNNKAYYYLAASNELGRKNSSSNGMIWYLINHLHSMGICELDLVGIDPIRNMGGYHFKKGFGGNFFAYAGEFECSSHEFFRKLVNFALVSKDRR